MKKFTIFLLAALAMCISANATTLDDITGIVPSKIVLSTTDQGYCYVQVTFTFYPTGDVTSVNSINRTTTTASNVVDFNSAYNSASYSYNIFDSGLRGTSTVTIQDSYYIGQYVQQTELLKVLSNLNYSYSYDLQEVFRSVTGKVYLDYSAYSGSVVTAVDDVNATKTVAGVKYYNINGQQSAEPFSGVNVMVTTYTDGTQSTSKMVK